MNDELYSELNTLLRILDGLEVLKLIKEHYKTKFKNTAPENLLEVQMGLVQRRLNLHQEYIYKLTNKVNND